MNTSLQMAMQNLETFEDWGIGDALHIYSFNSITRCCVRVLLSSHFHLLLKTCAGTDCNGHAPALILIY